MIKIRKGLVDLVIYQSDQTYANNNVKKSKLRNQTISEKIQIPDEKPQQGVQSDESK